MEKEKQNFGLNILTPDSRDFQLGAIVTLPSIMELPNEYSVKDTTEPYDQKGSDFCAAFASTAVSRFQEGVDMIPEWLFARAKQDSGDDVNSYGLNFRQVAKTVVNYGIPERSLSDYSVANKTVDFLRRFENWPINLSKNALSHRKGSFFAVTGDSDAFNNIKRALWKFRSEDCAIFLGVLWSWPLSQVIMDRPGTFGSGHAIECLGWTVRNEQEYLIIKNSYGKAAGENGYHYFSREVINTFVPQYGAFLFHDMPKEVAQYHLDNNLRIDQNWFSQMFTLVGNFISNIFK